MAIHQLTLTRDPYNINTPEKVFFLSTVDPFFKTEWNIIRELIREGEDKGWILKALSM